MYSNKTSSSPKTRNITENKTAENGTSLLNKKLIEQVNKLSDKNADLKNTVATLKMELYELNTKHNKLIDLVQKIRQNLLKDFLPNALNMVNICSLLIPETQLSSNTLVANKVGPKTHAVKPQIVNGNVLYSPTVSLTRYDLESPSPTSTESNIINLAEEESERDSDIIEIESSDDSSTELNGIEQEPAYQVPEVNRSKSILSGLFNEVKIYLNQLPSNTDSSHCSVEIPGSSSKKCTEKNQLQKRKNNIFNGFLGDLAPSPATVITPEKLECMRSLGLAPVNSMPSSETPPNRYSRRLVRKNLYTRGETKTSNRRITKKKAKRSAVWKERQLVIPLENISPNIPLEASVNGIPRRSPKNDQRELVSNSESRKD